jgi:hypothetical protein
MFFIHPICEQDNERQQNKTDNSPPLLAHWMQYIVSQGSFSPSLPCPDGPTFPLTRSIKGKVKRKIFPIAGIFLAFRPRGLSTMCLVWPHHSLGSWAWAREVGGFSRSGCHRLLARKP